MKNSVRIWYDEEGGFLGISLGKPAKCYATEVLPDIFVRKDEKTGEVKITGIFNFKKQAKNIKENGLVLPIDVE